MLFHSEVKRDVVPLGGEYYVDDDGFRTDFVAAGQRALNALERTKSLAILGEPGIGKSRALRELTVGDSHAIHVGLDTVSDVPELLEQLSLIDDAAIAGGLDSVTLVLDSMDECPIPTKTLLKHLEATLERHRYRGLRVLLGCRTADWPELVGTRLRALLPDFDVFELLPLGRTDISNLAATRGVDGGEFLAAVVGAAATALATLPLTLDLLLVTYQQAGRLPESPMSLYEQGLLRLAEEPDPDRHPAKRPAGSAPQRLAVAAKVAAYTMLCGRGAIARTAPSNAGDLLAGALAAGSEPIDGGDVPVTAELVDAALSTALFTGRGAGRLSIVHASFAAYLTARYLTSHAMPDHQLRAVLTRTNALGRTRVPSRLRETAAWLVALAPDRNSWLIDVDPEALAAHSGLIGVASVRRALASYLLDATNPELRTARRRWRLAHDGLAEQLRPALSAPLTQDAGPHFGHPVSRRAQVALEIARRAGGHGSVTDIVDLLLCRTANSYLRSSAAYALIDLDATMAAQTLRSVLDEVVAHPDHDPNDELRGIALATNWPENLTPARLVDAMTHPQQTNVIGSYALFLSGFLNEVDDHVISALLRAIVPPLEPGGGDTEDAWVDEDSPPPSSEPPPVFALLTGTRRGTRVMTTLLARALASGELGLVVDEVGWLLATAIQQHQNMALPARFGNADWEDAQDRQLRRALLLAALRHMPVDRAGLLVIRVRDGGRAGLLIPADLDWLLSLGESQWSAHAAELIRFVFDSTDIRHQEAVWAHHGEAIFHASVGRWFDAVNLHDPEADRMREQHEWSLERDPTWDGAEEHRRLLEDSWALCEQGEPEGFAGLCALLRVDPKTGDVTTNDDLVTWPSYALVAVDEAVLRASAEAYLLGDNDGDATWFDKPGTLAYRALVGYVALAYLARSAQGDARLDALPERVWQRWTPAILRFPASLGDAEMQTTLKNKAVQHAPNAYREWAIRDLELQALADWAIGSMDDFARFYDDTLGDGFDAVLRGVFTTMDNTAAALHELRAASDDNPHPSVSDLHARMSFARDNATHLARFLVLRREKTVEWLRCLAEDAFASPLGARLVAAEALLTAGRVDWGDIFSGMQENEDFGAALATALASRGDQDGVLPRLTEPQLSNLWWWVETRWSSGADAMADGFVSDDQHIRDWRNGIVAQLQARATPAALAALAGLVALRPDDFRLQAALIDAETREHDENWQAVTVAELTALLSNGRRTLVNDDDALYRAVLASLDRFAVRMREIGQTLWNEGRPKSSAKGGARVWSPKYEPDVSASLRDHLMQEFGEQLVVNREVLVKQTTSKGHGLSVDVLPTATESASGRRLPTCPIEVKGCWNAGLLTDLQAQLVADYLPATGATRGVYVCAWFPTSQWDDLADTRRQRAASRDRESVTHQLTSAAQIASESGAIEVAAVVIDIPRPTPSARVAGEFPGSRTAP